MPPNKPPRPRPAPAPEPEADEPDLANATLCDGEPPADPNATVLTPGPALPKRGGATAKLAATKGPKAGTEFPLGPGETSIGRQGDNTIVIPDISVSRKHIVVRKDGAAFILVDQGSGNGTQLNGARVEEETELQDGDVIVMGDTELVFHAPRSAAPAPRPTPRAPGGPSSGRRPAAGRPAPIARRQAELSEEGETTGTSELPFDPRAGQKQRRKRLLIVAGAVVFLLVVLGVVKMRQQNAAAFANRQQEEAEIARIEGEANEAYEAGKKAINAGDFKAAAKHLETSIEKTKEIQGDTRDLERRLDFAKRELNAQLTVDEAKALAEKGALAAAVEKLNTIPEESFFRDKVGDIIEEMKKKIPERIAQGKAALSTKDFTAASQAVTDVRAVDANNAEASELSAAIVKAGQPVPVFVKPKEKKEEEDPTAKAVAAFVGGNVDEAIGMAAACDDQKCKVLKDKLSTFRDAFAHLEAPGSVEKAIGVLRSIPGGTGAPYMAKIAQQATPAVKEGLKAMSAENYPKAFASFRSALMLDPDNADAKRNMGIIKIKARELSEQAYIDMTQDQDKARRGYEQILQMTEPGDELHQKAKNRLKKLTGGGE